MTNREQAWEKHLNEQKWVFGMPGLKARPAFEAGWQARDAEVAALVAALREAQEQITANMPLKDFYQEWDSETIAKIDALLREYTPKEKRDE